MMMKKMMKKKRRRMMTKDLEEQVLVLWTNLFGKYSSSPKPVLSHLLERSPFVIFEPRFDRMQRLFQQILGEKVANYQRKRRACSFFEEDSSLLAAAVVVVVVVVVVFAAAAVVVFAVVVVVVVVVVFAAAFAVVFGWRPRKLICSMEKHSLPLEKKMHWNNSLS